MKILVGEFFVTIVAVVNSIKNCLIQRFSRVVCASAIYSASMLDNATVGCFFELQVVAPPEGSET
jgi:hypothetical protein